MKKIIILLALLLSCQLGFGQRQSFAGYNKAGDEAMAQNDYYSAFQYYKVALEFAGQENDSETLYKLGEAANKANAYRTSIAALLQLADLPEATEYPLLRYYLGDDYFRTGAYDLGALNFQSFLDEQPDADPILRQKATEQIANANWAIEELAEARDINIRHLGDEVNSAFSDFGYTERSNSDTYFSSIRYKWKQDTMNPPRRLSKILLMKADGKPQPLEGEMDLDNRHVSHTAFNSSGDILFFSICEYLQGDEMSCEIYRADITADGSCTNVRPVDALNQEGTNSRMPNFGRLDDGREVVFFASDRPGGAGGMDLYYATMNGGEPGVPENLSGINTAGNDVTPFFLTDRQTLFFATDGRFSFGGLDLYKSYFSDNAFMQPINLGSPVNSSFDDAYYSQFASDEVAYLSSTRQVPEAIFFSEDKEVCCYDIYAFEPDNRIDLLAKTFNKITNEDLYGATVTLYEITPNGRVEIETIENIEGNEFGFKLEPGRRYELVATKNGLSTAIDEFDLNDPELKGKGFIRRDLYLSPGMRLDVLSFNGNDNQALENVKVELFEIDADGNEILIAEKTNPTGNDVFFDLDAGKRYLIRGTRPGFGIAEKEIDLTDYIPDGSTRTEELYLGQLLEILVVDGTTDDPLTGATVDLGRINGERVSIKTNPTGHDFSYTVNLNQSFVVKTSRPEYQSRVDTLLIDPAQLEEKDGRLRYIIPLYPNDLDLLLPLSVYFDNDHPNPRTYTTTTNLAYDDTYGPYIGRKNEFIEEYTEGLDANTKFVTSVRFEDFFDLQVRGGYEKLKAFAAALEQHLRDGNSFEMELRGFASPRAKEEYNRRLSARRNVAVRNYFRRYNNGALVPYLESGKLSFTNRAYGENRPTAETISDRLDDPKASVFSVIASLQRRVEIARVGDDSRKKK